MFDTPRLAAAGDDFAHDCSAGKDDRNRARRYFKLKTTPGQADTTVSRPVLAVMPRKTGEVAARLLKWRALPEAAPTGGAQALQDQ